MRRTTAPKTKAAIAEITRSKGKAGCRSIDIVTELGAAKYQKMLEEERSDLLPIALAVLAGRMTSKPVVDEDAQLFQPHEIPMEFTELRFGDGNFNSGRYATMDLTPAIWSARVALPAPLPRKPPQNEMLDEKFRQMREAGVSIDMTLREFLKRNGV